MTVLLVGSRKWPFILARLVARETKRVSELTPEDASSTFAATLPLENLKVMLSRCVTDKWRTPAEEKFLGFYDITRAHFHSPARRTIVINVPEKMTVCERLRRSEIKPCTERRMLHSASMLRVRMP